MNTSLASNQDPMVMRLAFLITPRDEFKHKLGVVDQDEGHSFTTAITTPELHYEQHFEGWKNAWREKAKRDFIAEFIQLWRDNNDALGEAAKALEKTAEPLAVFDRFWRFDDIDTMEIDPDWRPNLPGEPSAASF